MEKRTKQLWTDDVISMKEDKALKKLVSETPNITWSERAKLFSENFGIRTPKQCRERWVNYLEPGISFEKYSIKEQELVFMYLKIHGNHWSKIAKELKGRTENSVKNFFYSTVRKNLRRTCKMLQVSFDKKIEELIDDPFLNDILVCTSNENLRKLQVFKEKNCEDQTMVSENQYTLDSENAMILCQGYGIFMFNYLVGYASGDIDFVNLSQNK